MYKDVLNCGSKYRVSMNVICIVGTHRPRQGRGIVGTTMTKKLSNVMCRLGIISLSNSRLKNSISPQVHDITFS